MQILHFSILPTVSILLYCKSEIRVRVEALVQSSYGVPEGQPQCKSSPLRAEIQDVALKEKQSCVCGYVCF